MVKTFATSFIASIIICATSAAQEFTFFVDKNSLAEDPTGLTWDDAFKMLQPAVDAADIAIQATTQPLQASASIWVAEGVYDEERTWFRPDEPGSDLGALSLASNVILYGGFNGTEGSLSQRSIVDNRTVVTGVTSLSGEPAPITVVAWDVENAGLDGIVIDGQGVGSGVTVALSQDINFEHCQFEGIVGRLGVSTALSVGDGSVVAVHDSHFIDNFRQGSGGAVLLDGTATFTECLFQDNASSGAGGAVLLRNGAQADFDSCRFINNSISQNLDGVWGGAISVGFASANVTNSLFFGNSAPRGAALGNLGSVGPMQVTNCTFVANSTDFNSVVFIEEGGMSVENSIFWDNQGTLFGSNDGSIEGIIKDNLIQDLSDMSVTGLPDRFMDHNIEADPLFVNAAKMDFRLQPMSPAIDIGAEQVTDPLDEDIKTGPAPDEDIAGIMRPQLTTWDLGMHEYRPGFENDVDANNAINAVDVQLVINGALGLETPTASYTDTNFDNFTNAVDVQKVINAALGIHTK